MRIGYVVAVVTGALARLAWDLVHPGPDTLSAVALRTADE